MAGWILRTFSSRDKNVLSPLYKALVLSRIEYNCLLWSPSSSGQIARLESVQRSFTRRIDHFSGQNRPNYWERLTRLNMYSLERRRERYAVLYIWKVLQGISPNPGFQPSVNPRTGTNLKLPTIGTSSPCWVKTLRRSSFVYKGSRIFNSLPKHLRHVDVEMSLITYKKQLDSFLLTIPDQPTVQGLSRAASTNSIVDQIGYARPQ